MAKNGGNSVNYIGERWKDGGLAGKGPASEEAGYKFELARSASFACVCGKGLAGGTRRRRIF
jgi:hypothetical protein